MGIFVYRNRVTKAISRTDVINHNSSLYELIDIEINKTIKPETKSMTKLTFTKIHEDARIPRYAHDGDAGLDIWGLEGTVLKRDTPKVVSTGLTVEVPYGFELQVRSRSGLAFKRGIFLANGVGTIDYGFKGEIKILLSSPYSYQIIDPETAIAQLVLCRLEQVEIYEQDRAVQRRVSQNLTSIRNGGFGSTDV
jgi:dUTP pyrophosphatase